MPTTHSDTTRPDLNEIAWRFVGSEFAGQIYANWPIERRVDAYLSHHEMSDVARDGAACDALLQCVMANIGRAQRSGVLVQ